MRWVDPSGFAADTLLSCCHPFTFRFNFRLPRSSLTEEQARASMHKLLAATRQAGGSDLFISHDFPPSMKANGSMQPLT